MRGSASWAWPTLCRVRAGFYRDPQFPATLPVPPGLDQFVMSPIPWELWTGEPPRVHFRAPFELVSCERVGEYVRARFRNPPSSGRALPLAAAIDWPVWPEDRTAAVRPLIQRSA